MIDKMNDIFGRKLQKARIAKGISVSEAADATRMRPEKILALEASDLSKFPSAAYAKSFLQLYARFLGVDVKEIASTIDTGTHLTFDDYAYLRNANLPDMNVSTRPDAPTPTGYAAPSVRIPEQTSLLPLVIVGVIGVLGLFGFMIYSNIGRLTEAPLEPPPAVAPTPVKAVAVVPESKPAVIPPQMASQTQAATVAPAPRPIAPAPQAFTPLPQPTPVAVTPLPAPVPSAVVAIPPSTPKPVVVAPPPPTPIIEPEVRAAIPVSTANKLTVNDAEALMELDNVPTPNATADPADVAPVEEDNSVEDMLVIEPKRKVSIIVRKDGPEGAIEFSDTLHPRAKGLRLPAGKWHIQSADPEAIVISKSGHAIPYAVGGVLVE